MKLATEIYITVTIKCSDSTPIPKKINCKWETNLPRVPKVTPNRHNGDLAELIVLIATLTAI